MSFGVGRVRSGDRDGTGGRLKSREELRPAGLIRHIVPSRGSLAHGGNPSSFGPSLHRAAPRVTRCANSLGCFARTPFGRDGTPDSGGSGPCGSTMSSGFRSGRSSRSTRMRNGLIIPAQGWRKKCQRPREDTDAPRVSGDYRSSRTQFPSPSVAVSQVRLFQS